MSNNTLLEKLGRPDLKGYGYVKEALSMEPSTSLGKIYDIISKNNNTTIWGVERAIRNYKEITFKGNVTNNLFIRTLREEGIR